MFLSILAYIKEENRNTNRKTCQKRKNEQCVEQNCSDWYLNCFHWWLATILITLILKTNKCFFKVNKVGKLTHSLPFLSKPYFTPGYASSSKITLWWKLSSLHKFLLRKSWSTTTLFTNNPLLKEATKCKTVAAAFENTIGGFYSKTNDLVFF